MIRIENRMYRVMDIHTHIYPEAIAQRAVTALGAFYDFIPEGLGTYADLTDGPEDCRPDGFLLLCVATNAHQVEKVNDFVADKLHEARAAGLTAHAFMGMHQDYPDKLAELARGQARGFEGLKIHPDIQGVHITDPRLYPVYEWLEAHGMTVYFHVGDQRPQYPFSKPEQVVQIAKDFPRLRIGAAHMGVYMEDIAAGRIYEQFPNVWFDISSTLWYMPREQTEYLIDVYGSDRVMFGTDYPVKRLRGEIERFASLHLSDAVRADILWNNAARFFGTEKVPSSAESLPRETSNAAAESMPGRI